MEVVFLDGDEEDMQDFEVDFSVGFVGVGLEAGFVLVFAFVGGPGVGVGMEKIKEGFDRVPLVAADVEDAIAGCLFDTKVDGEGPRAGMDVPELPFFGVGGANDASVFAV